MGEMPWSPAEAEQKLANLVDQMGEEVLNLKRIAVDAAQAKHDYELANSREYAKLRVMGVSHQEADRRCILAVENEHANYLASEAVARSTYKYIDVLKAQCDGLRSLLVSARGVSS